MTMGQADQSPVLVLGMHRSGTSLLAQLLHASGILMGREFVKTSGGNPAGLYEDARYVEWHEAVLASEAGGEWPLCGMRWARRQPVKEMAWQAAAERHPLPEAAEDGLWGWKDPRTLLFLKQWLAVYPSLRGLVLVRHPTDVYLSLLRRGDLAVALDPLLAFEMYAAYHEAALPVIEAHRSRFLFVSSDHLFREWDAACAGMEKWLQHPIRYKEVRPRAAHFHPSLSDATNEARLSETCPRAMRAYARLVALAEGRPMPVVPSQEESSGSEAALLAYESSLPGGERLSQRRLQLRVELGQSLDKISDGAQIFEAKARYYEGEIGRLQETARVLSEQKAHLERQVQFMRENAGVEAWRARRTIMQMRQTLSWRVTAPLRRIRRFFSAGADRSGEEDR
jgi:hypothetical protein